MVGFEYCRMQKHCDGVEIEDASCSDKYPLEKGDYEPVFDIMNFALDIAPFIFPLDWRAIIASGIYDFELKSAPWMVDFVVTWKDNLVIAIDSMEHKYISEFRKTGFLLTGMKNIQWESSRRLFSAEIPWGNKSAIITWGHKPEYYEKDSMIWLTRFS